MPLSMLCATRVIAAARRQNPKAGEKNVTGVAVGKTGWLLRRGRDFKRVSIRRPKKRGERKKTPPIRLDTAHTAAAHVHGTAVSSAPE